MVKKTACALPCIILPTVKETHPKYLYPFACQEHQKNHTRTTNNNQLATQTQYRDIFPYHKAIGELCKSYFITSKPQRQPNLPFLAYRYSWRISFMSCMVAKWRLVLPNQCMMAPQNLFNCSFWQPDILKETCWVIALLGWECLLLLLLLVLLLTNIITLSTFNWLSA